MIELILFNSIEVLYLFLLFSYIIAIMSKSKTYWFSEDRFLQGGGVPLRYPITWQGFLIVGIYILLFPLGAFIIYPLHSDPSKVQMTMMFIFGSINVVSLIIISEIKGKPRNLKK